jgi:uncharacterized protein (DUF1786 family)
MNVASHNKPGLIAIDIGGGTQDIFVFLEGESIENCPKMVMPSPTRLVAEKISAATAGRRPVFLFGETMGGGVCAGAAKNHIAAGLALYATPSAALTFTDNVKRLEKMGVTITEHPPADAVRIRTGDVNAEALAVALDSFGVDIPSRWAVAVQDHGYSPDASNREGRFKWFSEFIDSGGRLAGLAFEEPPEFFTRMLAVKSVLPDAVLMDTGPAAIMGALLDETVAPHKDEGLVVVNVGNFHVMCAMVKGDRMLGLLEHHTGLMDTARLMELLDRFREGRLSNEEILKDRGHGCYVDDSSVGKGLFEFVAVTGPRRELLRSAKTHMAVPYGDMMLTGCFGLVDAARKLGIISG